MRIPDAHAVHAGVARNFSIDSLVASIALFNVAQRADYVSRRADLFDGINSNFRSLLLAMHTHTLTHARAHTSNLKAGNNNTYDRGFFLQHEIMSLNNSDALYSII